MFWEQETHPFPATTAQSFTQGLLKGGPVELGGNLTGTWTADVYTNTISKDGLAGEIYTCVPEFQPDPLGPHAVQTFPLKRPAEVALTKNGIYTYAEGFPFQGPQAIIPPGGGALTLTMSTQEDCNATAVVDINTYELCAECVATQPNQHGLDFIRQQEGGIVNHAYNDGNPGNCTVGVGHLVHHGPCTNADTSEYGSTTATGKLSHDAAEQLFESDVKEHLKRLRKAFDKPVDACQLDALLDYVYNHGSLTPFGPQLAAMDFPGIAAALPATHVSVAVYDQAGNKVIDPATGQQERVVSQVLVRRRQKEAAMLMGTDCPCTKT